MMRSSEAAPVQRTGGCYPIGGRPRGSSTYRRSRPAPDSPDDRREGSAARRDHGGDGVKDGRVEDDHLCSGSNAWRYGCASGSSQQHAKPPSRGKPGKAGKPQDRPGWSGLFNVSHEPRGSKRTLQGRLDSHSKVVSFAPMVLRKIGASTRRAAALSFGPPSLGRELGSYLEPQARTAPRRG